MTTEMALTTRTSLGPVRRLAMVLTVSVLAGMGSIAVAPVAAADDDDTSIATQVEFQDDDSDDDRDGDRSVVDSKDGKGPDAFIVSDHGRRPVFFCDVTHAKKRHTICTVPVTTTSRF